MVGRGGAAAGSGKVGGLPMSAVHWSNERAFELDQVTFHTMMCERFDSSNDHFMLAKPRHMVERYEELMSRLRPKRIVELGIFQGGSAALFALLARPDRLVALDIQSDPVPALDHFIDERDLRDRVRTYYGFDQSDGDGLRRLVADEFGDRPIDLVVDDASHRLGPTRASFNVLFPHVRPGGVYVIEDWSGLHVIDAALQAQIAVDPTVREQLEDQVRAGRKVDTPLSVLLFELILAAAYAPQVIEEILVADGWAQAVRGREAVDPDTFEVSRLYTDLAGSLLTTTT
jgi:predicted O-methyltransferase YrrM